MADHFWLQLGNRWTERSLVQRFVICNGLFALLPGIHEAGRFAAMAVLTH